MKTYYVNHADNNDCINPLSLLTAVGNGKGCGDYFGLNSCDIGIWAWDIISIEDEIPEYTVTYSDGVEGEEIFPDEEYAGVKR